METEIESAKTNLLQQSAVILLNRVWTRKGHGNFPVNVWSPRETNEVLYEVERPEGICVYTSARRLLKDVTGYRRPPSFHQYFRLDRENSYEKPNLLILLDQNANRVLVPGISSDPKQTRIAFDSLETETQTWKEELDRSKELLRKPARSKGMQEELVGLDEISRGLIEELDRYAYLFPSRQFGIDLVNRAHEVRKLLFAGFRGKMLSKRYEPEDVLQIIYMGLLARNKGKCPWDPKKSTFGYYVHMCINGILTNYHRKESRREDKEFVDIDDVVGLAGSVSIDAYGAGDELAREGLKLWLSQPKHGGNTQEGRLAIKLLPLVGDGYTRREIVQKTGLKETAITKALAHLKRWSAVWAEEIGVVLSFRRN
jgi:hypothetical protein